MKIAGIIAEYNPFHAGHQYHIRRTRECTGCDYVVAVMGGHFTQRGTPAFASKWARARAALTLGVDAVFELPALFAVRTADAFAQGGVSVLAGLQVDVLSFGTELPLRTLEEIADLRLREPAEVSRAIRQRLDAGMPHARARGEAYAAALQLPAQALENPNAVLAAEYLLALRRLGAGMRPVAIARVGAYHGGAGGFLSASEIREAFFSGAAAREMLPEGAREQLLNAGGHRPDAMWLHALRGLSPQAAAALPHAGEGLDRLLLRECQRAGTVEELMDRMKSRRYTRARISRLLAHALIGLTEEMTQRIPVPPYARLLGARKDAGALLQELKRRCEKEIAPDPTRLSGDECFQLECRATDLWALGADDPAQRGAGREFTEKFVSV